MSSAIEQLASNINFSTVKNAEDFKNRIFFTLAALAVYRIGTYIPLPGINPQHFRPALLVLSSDLLGDVDVRLAPERMDKLHVQWRAVVHIIQALKSPPPVKS